MHLEITSAFMARKWSEDTQEHKPRQDQVYALTDSIRRKTKSYLPKDAKIEKYEVQNEFFKVFYSHQNKNFCTTIRKPRNGNLLTI